MAISTISKDLDHQIAFNFLARLREVLLSESRANLVAAFAAAGLDFDAFNRHPEQFVHADFFNLLHRLNQPEHVPGVVIKFGMSREIFDLGVLGYTIISCADIRQALKLMSRYHSLTAEGYQTIVSEKGSRAYSRQWIKPNYRARRIEINEDHITGFWLALKTLLPGNIDMSPIRIQLGYPDPGYGSLYREAFACEVVFDQKDTLVSYPREWLDLPIQTADEVVKQVSHQQCELMLGKLNSSSVIVDDVRRLILTTPRDLGVKIEDVAAQMLLTVRTLERRLKAAGTSFRAINNEVKMGLAEEYLRLGYLSGKEIANLLNYAQPATFYRAFRIWFGMTPKEFRRRHLTGVEK